MGRRLIALTAAAILPWVAAPTAGASLDLPLPAALVLPAPPATEVGKALGVREPAFNVERIWKRGVDDWEPALATDPSSSRVYQMTTRYGGPRACPTCPDPAMVIRMSRDHGETWGPDRFVCACPGVDGQHDPQVEVAMDGRVYAVWMNDFTPGAVFARSSDHGRTWTEPVELLGALRWTDKPILAISKTGRHVYVAFNMSDSYFVASHDFGRTFSSPVKSNRDGLYYFAGGGAVAPGGAVYFSETAYAQNNRGPVNILVIRSTNGGRTWTQTVVDVAEEQPPCTVPGCPRAFFGPQAALAIDRDKVVMVAYNANSSTRAPQRLYVRTSTDGVNWSERIDVGEGHEGANAAFPALAAGQVAGDFRLGWQDDRNGARAWNTWFRRTVDGGARWTETVRLSDRPRGTHYKSADGYRLPYGDYFEIGVDPSGLSHVIWGEGPHYTGPGSNWYTQGR
jgi:BNR repeat-like domain